MQTHMDRNLCATIVCSLWACIQDTDLILGVRILFTLLLSSPGLLEQGLWENETRNKERHKTILPQEGLLVDNPAWTQDRT